MKRVLEIEGEPEIGKYYLVPCVKNKYDKFVPVLGVEHDDKDYIGVAEPHYHHDVRFATESLLDDIGGFRFYHGMIACSLEEYVMTAIVFSGAGKIVTERRMKCLRKMPVFPLRIHSKPAKWMPALEAAYKDTTLNCARCPHRGIPLSEENADENGVVVCPGHGLAWDMKTGRLVSRLK